MILEVSLYDLQGLVRCVRDKKRKKIAVGERIICLTERDVFDHLNLPYKEPWERNCLDTSVLARPDVREDDTPSSDDADSDA